MADSIRSIDSEFTAPTRREGGRRARSCLTHTQWWRNNVHIRMQLQCYQMMHQVLCKIVSNNILAQFVCVVRARLPSQSPPKQMNTLNKCDDIN
jgi:hypothetical protein